MEGWLGGGGGRSGGWGTGFQEGTRAGGRRLWGFGHVESVVPRGGVQQVSFEGLGEEGLEPRSLGTSPGHETQGWAARPGLTDEE